MKSHISPLLEKWKNLPPIYTLNNLDEYGNGIKKRSFRRERE